MREPKRKGAATPDSAPVVAGNWKEGKNQSPTVTHGFIVTHRRNNLKEVKWLAL